MKKGQTVRESANISGSFVETALANHSNLTRQPGGMVDEEIEGDSPTDKVVDLGDSPYFRVRTNMNIKIKKMHSDRNMGGTSRVENSDSPKKTGKQDNRNEN